MKSGGGGKGEGGPRVLGNGERKRERMGREGGGKFRRRRKKRRRKGYYGRKRKMRVEGN